jgi:hypothetical protein
VSALPWDDDYYFLFGKLEALDAPGEWFQRGSDLYFKPPSNIDLLNDVVEGKVRDLVIHGKNLRNIEIRGLTFFGGTLQLRDCISCVVENNRFLYPVFNRDLSPTGPVVKYTQMTGRNNVFRGNIMRYSVLGGFMTQGEGNIVEGNNIRGVSMFGGNEYAGIKVVGDPAGTPSGSTVSSNTVQKGGGPLITFWGGPHLVEMNHVADGGILGTDVSLLYTQAPEARGSVVRYNWVHGSRASRIAIGIRGDDQTRGLTIHHNVIWDCYDFGLEIKGDENLIYNNTVFAIRRGDNSGYGMLFYLGPEPYKPWREQAPLLPAQNRNSEIKNNAMTTMVYDGGRPLPRKYRNALTNNYVGGEMELEDPFNFGFTPMSHSPLVDGGVEMPGITGAFDGPFPDIGAYEYNMTPWTPGTP